MHNPFRPGRDFSAFRSTDYGYTRLKAFNSTHLYMEQVSDDKVRINRLFCYEKKNKLYFNLNWKNGEIIDSIWIIKNRHDKYK